MSSPSDVQTADVSAALREVLQKHGSFESLPERLLNELAGAGHIRHFDPDEVILRQGEINNNLYFLLIGSVDIYVDNGLVATLKRKGDLLGEMSVITNKPCSATILARTPVELLCIDISEFRKVTGGILNEFDYAMYRIYSLILTDKLVITNEKAKRLEDTLADLQRAKTELQEINKQIERRVSERTRILQSKLEVMLNNHIHSLNDSLKAGQIATSLQQLNEVTKVLEPIVQTFTLEVSMKSKRVLLAQGQKPIQTLARLALGGTGIQIETSPSVEQSREHLKAGKFDVVLIDRESLSLLETVGEKIGETAGESPAHFVYLATKSIPEQLPQLLQLKKMPDILFLREDDRAANIRAIMTTITKLCSPSIFGIEKYLNVGVEIKELPVTKSTERQELNEKMREHFTKLGVRSSVLDSVAIVVEELLMNAIYDAPVDLSGKPLYNNLPRTTPVELKPEQHGLFRMGIDGTLLGISVEDPFGALTGNVVLNYLDSCYGGRAGEMQAGKGGAGRGIHQIIENSEFVVFNVQPKRRTEVLAFFDVVPGAKEAKMPLLHYFCRA